MPTKQSHLDICLVQLLFIIILPPRSLGVNGKERRCKCVLIVVRTKFWNIWHFRLMPLSGIYSNRAGSAKPFPMPIPFICCYCCRPKYVTCIWIISQRSFQLWVCQESIHSLNVDRLSRTAKWRGVFAIAPQIHFPNVKLEIESVACHRYVIKFHSNNKI